MKSHSLFLSSLVVREVKVLVVSVIVAMGLILFKQLQLTTFCSFVIMYVTIIIFSVCAKTLFMGSLHTVDIMTKAERWSVEVA